MADFKTYCFIGDVDLKKAELLHNLIAEYKDAFLVNQALQNLLLNRGYDVEERPNSFFDFHNVIYLRSNTMFQLQYLEYIMSFVENPKLAVVETNAAKVIAPDEKETLEMRTKEGFNFLSISELKNGWLENLQTVEKIREYHKNLSLSFEEFNLQFILTRVRIAKSYFVPSEEPFQEEKSLQDKIKQVFEPGIYTALDSAYYSTAVRYLSIADRQRKELLESDYGIKFVATPQEVHEAIIKFRS